MHVKYIKGCHPLQVKVEKPPLSWRRLENIQTTAKSNIRWCVGKGFVDFWYDRWLFDLPLVDLISIQDLPHMLLAEFYGAMGWNVEKLMVWLLP